MKSVSPAFSPALRTQRFGSDTTYVDPPASCNFLPSILRSIRVRHSLRSLKTVISQEYIDEPVAIDNMDLPCGFGVWEAIAPPPYDGTREAEVLFHDVVLPGRDPVGRNGGLWSEGPGNTLEGSLPIAWNRRFRGNRADASAFVLRESRASTGRVDRPPGGGGRAGPFPDKVGGHPQPVGAGDRSPMNHGGLVE